MNAQHARELTATGREESTQQRLEYMIAKIGAAAKAGLNSTYVDLNPWEVRLWRHAPTGEAKVLWDWALSRGYVVKLGWDSWMLVISW